MKKGNYLREHYHSILSYTGLILLIGGFIIATPLLLLPAWPEEKIYASGFILPALILIIIGFIVWYKFKQPKRIPLSTQEGGIIVLISWITILLASALPFHLILKLSVTHSLFESVSGWTTTGLSVVDVASAPQVILIWRSIMQLAGGAGLAIIMLASITGPSGPGLSIAEGKGEQLVPNVRQSTKLVIVIYSGYVITGIIAYWIAGMSIFDAVNHSFAALSTGGFSTHPESMAYWNSPAIEIITIVLMLLGNLNFLTSYTILHGRVKAFIRNGEIRLISVIIPISITALFFIVCTPLYPVISKSVRVAIFEAVSALTTTGFSTVSYQNWNSFGFLILIVLMIIGGGTCSTAGGIKQYRVYILFKSLCWEIRNQLLPKRVVVENYIWQDQWKDFINDTRVRRVSVFVFLYLFVLMIGTGIITAYGFGFRESLFEFTSALGTVGLSTGITSQTTPATILWAEILGMFLGRLEFFIVFVSILKILTDIPKLLNWHK